MGCVVSSHKKRLKIFRVIHHYDLSASLQGIYAFIEVGIFWPYIVPNMAWQRQCLQ